MKVPESIIGGLRSIYEDSNALIFIQTITDVRIEMHGGHRQGGVRSSELFCLCMDYIIRYVAAKLSPSTIITIYVNDMAIIVENFETSIGVICELFQLMQFAASLLLHLGKTTIIPIFWECWQLLRNIMDCNSVFA